MSLIFSSYDIPINIHTEYNGKCYGRIKCKDKAIYQSKLSPLGKYASG
jgi:hypothetical protein